MDILCHTCKGTGIDPKTLNMECPDCSKMTWKPRNPCENCPDKKVAPTYDKCTLACGLPHEYQIAKIYQKKLLKELIALPDDKCIMLTINDVTKGAISKFTLEAMLKQLEEEKS